MTLELDCRNAVSMSSDCRGRSVCYPTGISLSPELGFRLRLETGFIRFLADPSMTTTGIHIDFLSPVWMKNLAVLLIAD